MAASFPSCCPSVTRANASLLAVQAAKFPCSVPMFKQQQISRSPLVDLPTSHFNLTPVTRKVEEFSTPCHHCNAEKSDGEPSRSPDDVIKESLLSSDDSSEENLPTLVLSIRQLAESVDKLAGTIISKNSEETGTHNDGGSNKVEEDGGRSESSEAFENDRQRNLN